MNNEEKKAIDGLFHLAHINTYLDLEKEDVVKVSNTLLKQWKDETKIVLNLIEKQQKQIEDKKAEIYVIAKTNYDVGVLDERNEWYKKIRELRENATLARRNIDM